MYSGDLTIGDFVDSALGLQLFLNDKFGVTAQLQGQRVIVEARSASRIFNNNILTLHGSIDIVEEKFGEISRTLINQVPTDLDKYNVSKPDRIRVSKGYGYLSDFESISIKLALEDRSAIAPIIENELLPFMASKMEATSIAGVSIDAGRQQENISFTKLFYLGLNNPNSDVIGLSQDKKAFDGILPLAPFLLDFVTALTRIAPYCFTLPVERHIAAWHFIGPGMYNFPYKAAYGMMDAFSASLAPLSESSDMTSLGGLSGMNTDNIWRYLRAPLKIPDILCPSVVESV